jgi:hypothetical protein
VRPWVMQVPFPPSSSLRLPQTPSLRAQAVDQPQGTFVAAMTVTAWSRYRCHSGSVSTT